MVKRFLIAGALAGMLATPAFAQNDSFADRVLTQENVGRALGAVAGGLIGSQIGGGSGKTIATAAGAVGGYILGGKVGREWGSGGAPSYGGGSGYQGGTYRHASNTSYLAPLREMPRLDLIDATYRATTTSNVRGGPSTRYVVVDQLYNGEPTRVVGRVVNTDWYMVADGDVIQGFVYAPLLEPADSWSRDVSWREQGGYVTDRYVSDAYGSNRSREFGF